MAGKFLKKKKRKVWPWLAGIGIAAALIVAGVVYGPTLLGQILRPETSPTGMASIPWESSEETAETEAPTTAPTETAAPSETEASETQPVDVPWNLTLVNASNALPEDWNIELTTLRNNEKIDSRIVSALQDMFDACRADGLLPVVNSGYRTAEDQQDILDRKIASFEESGSSHEDAVKEAAKWAAQPGYSEHQLGLAVDVDSTDTEKCPSQSVWDWMLEHCAEYGFILRYPEGEEETTGYSYEPWHFRYVGKDVAKIIMDGNMTLESYLSR